MTTAVLPDVDIEELVSHELACQGNYGWTSHTPCDHPAEWHAVLECGCTRFKCTPCLTSWAKSLISGPFLLYTVSCATCGQVYILSDPVARYRRL